MKKYEVDQRGYYGRFGGAFVPEVLHANVENLRKAYLREMSDPSSRMNSKAFCVITWAARRRFIWHAVFRSVTGLKFISNAKTSTIPAHTR